MKKNKIESLLIYRSNSCNLKEDLKELFDLDESKKYLNFLLKNHYISEENVVQWNKVLSDVYEKRNIDTFEYTNIEVMTYLNSINFPKEVSEYYSTNEFEDALKLKLINSPIVVEISEEDTAKEFFKLVAIPIIAHFMEENFDFYSGYLSQIEGESR